MYSKNTLTKINHVKYTAYDIYKDKELSILDQLDIKILDGSYYPSMVKSSRSNNKN